MIIVYFLLAAPVCFGLWVMVADLPNHTVNPESWNTND